MLSTTIFETKQDLKCSCLKYRRLIKDISNYAYIDISFSRDANHMLWRFEEIRRAMMTDFDATKKKRVTILEEKREEHNENFNEAYEEEEIEGDISNGGDTRKTLPETKQENNTRYFVPLQRWSAQITGFTLRNIYASTVEIPAEYTQHKHDQNKTLKNVARKVAGIPFALLYGFLLVWIISDVIIGKTKIPENSDSSFHFDVARNICETISARGKSDRDNDSINGTEPDLLPTGYSFNQTHDEKFLHLLFVLWKIRSRTPSSDQLFDRSSPRGYSVNNEVVVHNATSQELRRPQRNTLQSENYTTPFPSYDWSTNDRIPHSTTNGTEKQSILFENDSADLYTITLSVMAVVGISSVFSRNTRATMLLILPGLITRHSRNLIFTIVLGILVHKGPVDNLRSNFNKVIQNAACMYRTVVVIGCAEQDHFMEEMEEAKTIYKSLLRANEILEEARCRYDPDHCFRTKYPGLPQPNIAQLLSKLINPSTISIKKQSKVVIENVEKLGYYADIGRKAVTVLSILMLIIDAARYLRSYYTDSSFDNMYVGRTARRQWKEKHYYNKSLENEEYAASAWSDEQSLRRWERNQGFTTSKFPKFTGKELWKVVRRSLTTVLFSLFVLLTLSADYLLASALQYVKRNYNFTVSLGEMGANITERFQMHIEDIEYSTGSCLVAPSYTNTSVYWIISLFLLAAGSSCFFEVYMSRIRAKLCNIFYPDRAEERADFLYFRIISGRINRRINLLLQLRREEERRKKLYRFSPWQRLKGMFQKMMFWESHSFVCSGCGWKVRSTKEKYSAQLSFVVDMRRQTTNVCENCHLDVSNSDLNKSKLNNGVAKAEDGCF